MHEGSSVNHTQKRNRHPNLLKTGARAGGKGFITELFNKIILLSNVLAWESSISAFILREKKMSQSTPMKRQIERAKERQVARNLNKN